MPDFSIEEANEYLDKKGYTKDQRTRDLIFTKLGTRPSTLQSLINSNMNPEEFIEDRMKFAKDAIDALMVYDEKWGVVLQKLASDTNAKLGFIDIARALGVTDMTAIADGPAVKQLQILAYDVKDRVFTFYSPIFYWAVKRYFSCKNGIDAEKEKKGEKPKQQKGDEK